MLKILIRTLIILAVFALVAGGIYLLVQNSGSSLLGNIEFEGSYHAGNGIRPESSNFIKEQHSAVGDFQQGGEGGGFSAEGLSQLLENAGKVAIITIVVILIQGLIRFFRRRKKMADPSAV